MENQIALVTGASRGIGQAIALTLAQRGACVVGTATTDGGAEKITQQFNQANLKGEGVVVNVADQHSIAMLFEQLKQKQLLPSILVNNAGITRDNLLLRMKTEEWDEVIATNLTGAYLMIKACLKTMLKARAGRIINIGSVVGSEGNPGQVNYCAAKAGLIGLTKSLSLEIASRNITVNLVAPGFIETDMTNTLPEAQKTTLLAQIPLNRLGQAQDIANAVAFLASEEASYITGETIHVNGGMRRD